MLQKRRAQAFTKTGHKVLSSSIRAPQMWQEETLLPAVGKLGIFLKLAWKLKEVVSTGVSVFYSWTSMTNASPNYAPDTSLFWMLPPSEDAFVACSNPWPQILHSLTYLDGNMDTKSYHPSMFF